MNSSISTPYFKLDAASLSELLGPGSQLEAQASRLKEADQKLRHRYSSGEVGFYDYVKEPRPDLMERMRSYAAFFWDRYEGALLIGIGGSHLGAAALNESVGKRESVFALHWLSNIDPSAVREIEHFLAHRKLGTVISSKSGSTVETLVGFFHFSGALPPQGYVVITDPTKGYLRQIAQTQGWKTLDIPSNIGGRFSVLTPVGLFPAMLGGVDVEGVLAGAREMRSYLESFAPENNPAYQFADLLFLHNNQGRKIQYLMPYWQSLRLFSHWYVQLWGESLGKKSLGDHRRVGPTPAPALGTTDQHSILQLLKDGPLDKVVGFVDVVKSGKTTEVRPPDFELGEHVRLTGQTLERISSLAAKATRQSLHRSGIPTYTFEIGELTPQSMGGLLFFWMVATAISGELYGVNAFDQPGVEEAKRLLIESL